jgi:hypothetical protein
MKAGRSAKIGHQVCWPSPSIRSRDVGSMAAATGLISNRQRKGRAKAHPFIPQPPISRRWPTVLWR